MYLHSAHESQEVCIHCSAALPKKRQLRGDLFCCNGCRRVHELLAEKGWAENYRTLRERDSVEPQRPLFESLNTDNLDAFQYLDRLEGSSAYITLLEEGRRRMRFYLEGAHCTACIWLTEKVGESIPGVESLQLDLSNKVATATILPGGSFARVAKELALLGYLPNPIQKDEDESGSSRSKLAHRSELIRIAVTGAAAGNLMLLSISLYGGLKGDLADSFEWISGFIFLPVLTYGAIPFFRHAWGALRIREISIDLPISLGTIAGSVVSYLNLWRGTGKIYFDSIAGLVFLLLATRSALSRLTEKSEQRAKTLSQGLPTLSRDASTKELFPSENTTPGQLIEVLPGELVPVDGIIQDGESEISTSWLTGETTKTQYCTGTPLFAGSLNETGRIIIQATGSSTQSRLSQMLSEATNRNPSRTEFGQLTQKIGTWFTVGISISALFVAFTLWSTNTQLALDTAIALVLVACPCTFALATPLIFSRAIAALAQERVYTKSPDALERIAESRTIWFDKTGTLTQGKLKLIEVTESQNPEEHLRIAASLEKISRHPISRAILTAAEVEDVGSLFYVDAHKEIRGLGIEGKINGNAYLLGKPSKERAASNGAAISQDVRTEIDLLENGLPIARFSLGDSIKPEAYNLIRNLKNRGYKVGILSGDSQQTVDDLAQALGFPTSNCFGNLTPENKKHYLVQQDHPLFIGDGANDLLALSVSHASIALHTGIEASLKIADFACLSSSLHSIERILLTGDRTKKALRITLLISLLYNLCAITAAILGWVTPLFAAILMPCASTLTLLSGYLTTRDLIFSHETRQEKI